jgi:hypothetical protein
LSTLGQIAEALIAAGRAEGEAVRRLVDEVVAGDRSLRRDLMNDPDLGPFFKEDDQRGGDFVPAPSSKAPVSRRMSSSWRFG